jgi:mycothiol synthase
MSAAEMRDWFEMPDIVMLVAELAGGRIGGYADLTDQGLEHHRFWVDLRVPPAEGAAEIAAALLEAMEVRAAEVAAGDASVRVSVPPPYELGVRVAEERGYEVFRHSFQMRIEFDGELPAPEWPEGLSVRTFAPDQDDEAVYQAQNDAFADHFEHTHWPYENWRRWAFTESFDPSLWWLAEEGKDIAGVCLGRAEAGAGGELGWVNVLGVRPPWRRRGLGRALLLQSFAEFRARGKRGAGLGVDGLNTTGAVALYERAGMHVARRYDQYKKPLRA